MGWAQPLTEMSTCNLPGSKARPTIKADHLTAIREPFIFNLCGELTEQGSEENIWAKEEWSDGRVEKAA
jgi:hypothetical protein